MSTIEKLREVILKMKKKNIKAADLTPEAAVLFPNLETAVTLL